MALAKKALANAIRDLVGRHFLLPIYDMKESNCDISRAAILMCGNKLF